MKGEGRGEGQLIFNKKLGTPLRGPQPTAKLKSKKKWIRLGQDEGALSSEVRRLKKKIAFFLKKKLFSESLNLSFESGGLLRETFLSVVSHVHQLSFNFF